MDIKRSEFYRILAPRPTVLISTIDKEGNTNAAPFSFVMPVSMSPPLLAFASAPQRHTLANVRETREFVANLPPEEILDQLWITSKSFPKGVSEIKEAGLRERVSRCVKAPGIEECAAWFECRLLFEREAGDHVIVVGEVLSAQVKDETQFNPLMHISGAKFALPGKILQAEG